MIKHVSKIICVDSTHNTTQYDFMLTTVLVLDEYEEAVLVAWAVSNREDAEILEIFFKSVRDSCGQDFSTEIFMSDLANNFYNAWCSAYSHPTRRLYCSWHVDKCWWKHVKKCITSDENQCNTYAYLTFLQTLMRQIFVECYSSF